MNQIPVTVIGLGLMGQALAKVLLKRGHPTTVWNRSAHKADELAEQGATLAKTMSEAVTNNRVIMVCVSTYEVFHDLLNPIANHLQDRVLINLTSGSPEDARKTAEWASVQGAAYLDGAIMAVPPMIGTPEALIFYGGSKDVFDAHESLLNQLGGSPTWLSEDPGVPMLYDLALLTMLYGAGSGWLHAHALISTAGISAKQFQPYAAEWLNHMIAPSYGDRDAARVLDEADYSTDVSNLHTNQLALGHIIKASQELAIPSDWLLPLKKNYDQLVVEGYGEDSPERVFELLKRGNQHSL